jgi:hypothetical protein
MIGVLKDIIMKIWLNNKKIVKGLRYMHCSDCVLRGKTFGRRFECLALLYGIHHSTNLCMRGYKYETNV